MRLLDDDIELQRLIAKIGAVSPRQAGLIDNIGQTKVSELIKSGEYESYLEGGSRKITLRSMIERRKRLLAAAPAASSRTPPLKQAKSATTASTP
jgi:hypothetical protein